MKIAISLLYVIGIIIIWITFYYVVKAAVKNGIKAARADEILPASFRVNKPEKPANAEQIIATTIRQRRNNL